MDSKVQQIINILNTRLSQSFDDFEGSYLYGSRAGDNYSSQSDIDLVVIFSEMDRNKRMDIWGIVGKIEAEFDIFLDLHPMTKQELENNPVYHNQVVNNGIFYDAA